MAPYHRVSAFFPNREEAEDAAADLARHGMPSDRLKILSLGSSAPGPASRAATSLRCILVNGGIGIAAGAAVGLLSDLVLIIEDGAFFVASPVVAPIMLVMGGASLGAVIGAAVGTSRQGIGNTPNNPKITKSLFADLVRDALSTGVISAGQVVLVVETHSVQELEIASEIIRSVDL